MRSIELSDKELEVIIMALRDREDRMLRDAESYKSEAEWERIRIYADKYSAAQRACLQEWRIAQDIRERLQKER